MPKSELACDILVIGAGLQGCAIALFAARQGKQVTIVEKQLAGRHASGVNAGGLRLLMRDIREYPLSQRAMTMWANLGDSVGEPAAHTCEVRLGTSQIALAMDAAELQWIESRIRDMRRRGIQSEEQIDSKELRQLLPGLSENVLGGLISRGDGHANPAMTAAAFRLAAERAGARILEGCAVLDLSTSTGGIWRIRTEQGTIEARQVVNCAGAWGAKIAALVGEDMPLNVLALSMMVTTRVKPFITPVVLGIDQPLSFKQSAVGTLVIGGGICGKPCLDEGTSFTVMDRMTSNASALVSAFPSLENVQVLRTWTGLEGSTPDGVPFIGPSPRYENLWHVFGFCGHGFQLAPAVGEAVAHSLISGIVVRKLAPFSVDRFSRPLLNVARHAQ